MAEHQPRKICGATPKQLVLIGVLAIILVTVLCIQAGGFAAGPDGRNSNQPSAGPAVIPGRRPIVPAVSPSATEATSRPWSTVSLDEALRFDPFSLPVEMAEPATPIAVQEEQTAEADAPPPAWLTKGVKLIFSDGQTAVATIGSRVVHVDDVIGGYRVVAIDAAGVTLKREPIVPRATNK